MSQKELRKRLEGTVQVQHQQLKMGFLADLGGHVAKHVWLIRRNRSSWILQITTRKIVWCYTCCVISLFFLLSWGDYLWTRSAEALGVCIERKTMRDLIGRSAKGDHLRQLRRLSASRLPSALLLEGDISTAPRQVAYGADPIASSHSDTALRESLDVLCLLARQGRWSRQIHQILSTCNTIPVSQTSSYQKDMSIILVVGLGFPSKDPKKLVHKLPQPATTLMRLLLERRCFVLLTSNATDTATCLASWSSVIKDMSCCPKVPLDALKKAPESSDRDHSDLLACVHAAGLLKEHQEVIGRRFYSLDELRAAYRRCPDVQRRQLLLAPLLLLPMDADSQGDPSANNRAAASISCELFQAATAQSGGLKLTGPASAPEVQLCLKATTGISKDACLPSRLWLCMVLFYSMGLSRKDPTIAKSFIKSIQTFQQLRSQGNCVIAAG